MFLNFLSRESSLKLGKSDINFEQLNFFTYSRDAIYEICKINKINSESEILVPNYICSTVIDVLVIFTKKIKFYDINNKLNFDEYVIKGMCTDSTRLVLFVDYFGVESNISDDLIDFLKNKKILILKDAAHSFLTQVKNDFKSSYKYDYLVSSIYKNIQVHIGAIAKGHFDRKHHDIDKNLLIKRKIVFFIKKLFCMFGFIKFINRNIENLIIVEEGYEPMISKNNCYDKYNKNILSIDFSMMIIDRQRLSEDFFNFFNKKSLFTKEQIQDNVLQAYPIIFDNKNDRDSLLDILRKNCIDAYTWPTFHPLAINEKLWEKILLLPIDEKVLKLCKEII